MTFGDDLLRFSARIGLIGPTVFNRAADKAFESIVDGSTITAAPGQPVDTGHLKASWQNVFTSPTERELMTNTVYAPIIEDGMISLKGRAGDAGASSGGSKQRLTFRSAVGGPHSVKLTRAAWPLLVEAAAAEVGS